MNKEENNEKESDSKAPVTTARQYIIDNYGLNWINDSWDSGDVMEVMIDYATDYCVQENAELKKENRYLLQGADELQLTIDKLTHRSSELERVLHLCLGHFSPEEHPVTYYEIQSQINKGNYILIPPNLIIK